MLAPHSPHPDCAHPRDTLLQAHLSLSPKARGTQTSSPQTPVLREAPLLPAAADVPHRRVSVLPPGCGAVRGMILRQANLGDTVTQREALQHHLARGVTLIRSHCLLPVLTATGSSWVKTGLKPEGFPAPGRSRAVRGQRRKDGMRQDGTGRDHPAHPVLRCKEKPIL